MFQSSFLFIYIIINTEGGFINTKLVFSIGICFMSTHLFVWNSRNCARQTLKYFIRSNKMFVHMVVT